MYDMNALQYTSKGTYNEIVPGNNSQKTSEIGVHFIYPKVRVQVAVKEEDKYYVMIKASI